VLNEIFRHAAEAGRVDELGNGRFARSLFERACAHRDARVGRGEAPTAHDLTTVIAGDVRAAYQEMTGGRAADLPGESAGAAASGAAAGPGAAGATATRGDAGEAAGPGATAGAPGLGDPEALINRTGA
jgi:AAA lid domain